MTNGTGRKILKIIGLTMIGVGVYHLLKGKPVEQAAKKAVEAPVKIAKKATDIITKPVKKVVKKTTSKEKRGRSIPYSKSGNKPDWMVKGSTAAKARMAQIRAMPRKKRKRKSKAVTDTQVIKKHKLKRKAAKAVKSGKILKQDKIDDIPQHDPKWKSYKKIIKKKSKKKSKKKKKR